MPQMPASCSDFISLWNASMSPGLGGYCSQKYVLSLASSFSPSWNVVSGNTLSFPAISPFLRSSSGKHFQISVIVCSLCSFMFSSCCWLVNVHAVFLLILLHLLDDVHNCVQYIHDKGSSGDNAIWIVIFVLKQCHCLLTEGFNHSHTLFSGNMLSHPFPAIIVLNWC